ncbi:alkaline phosphatase [Microbulbifer pacificus]|uniref:Alkaline phosphatase n=1 Tax=Microbulbifer pacificus TaxID=407164 RepID=A0AAU0MUR2_9GAMM|nr:alkaline phosphatase [Microbulbifer pacificus]WOX04324.1 alkaline phosphatase [Microbulbifer pacificus]
MKRLSLLLLLCLTAQAGCSKTEQQSHTRTEAQSQPQPRNIIFMIGDGMGPAYTSGYRYFVDNPETKEVDPTVFDRLLVGTASTYPDDDTYVTDSAASATALATGIKSFNGAIGVDTEQKPLQSLLKHAKRLGKNTAIVVTSELNHATPASFVAHNNSRGNKDAIANDFIDIKINNRPTVDLMLGGGQQYFQRRDRDILQEFRNLGYQSATELSQLENITGIPAIGVFADKGLARAIDSDTPQRLSHMTGAALALLKKHSGKAGFFLMIEGSQIDWCGHANDIACAMREMDDFARSIEIVEKFIQENPDTLLVLTADHSTGGLSLAADKEYLWRTEVIAQQRKSLAEFSRDLQSDADPGKSWQENFGYPLQAQELLALKESQASSEATYDAVVRISSRYSNTGWTTRGHDAVDVQVFAYGHGSELFRGFQDNTAISKKILQLMDGILTH